MRDRSVRKKIHKNPELISNPAAAGSWPSGPSPPPWIDLPRDVTANILHRLGAVEILESAQKVCATWWRVCKEDPSMWRVIDMKNFDDDLEISNDLDAMCRYAVDRSRGDLIDINIEYFGTDDTLRYITDRSSRLRRLTIACCDSISGRGLTATVKKLLQLEELHLYYMQFITAEDIEAIGMCCPTLKSFTFNRPGTLEIVDNFFDYRDNSFALTIAKHMPDLRHLRLFGNFLGNEGLQAILDGCPHLESLDIRQCFGVGLQGDFDRRCSERIKDLRRPFDSTADYEWDDDLVYDSDDFGDIGNVEDYGQYEYDDYGHIVGFDMY